MDIIFKTKITTSDQTYESNIKYSISDAVAKKIGMFGDIKQMEKEKLDTTLCKKYKDYFDEHHMEYKE